MWYRARTWELEDKPIINQFNVSSVTDTNMRISANHRVSVTEALTTLLSRASKLDYFFRKIRIRKNKDKKTNISNSPHSEGQTNLDFKANQMKFPGTGRLFSM